MPNVPKKSVTRSAKKTVKAALLATKDTAALSAAKFSRDAESLITWYRGVRRDLPWRKNRDPYRIWISEVMLQQTTVAAVVPYYERFMKRFPTLKSLAEAPVEDVLENWAGLGYYSRARNLHKSAQVLAKEGFPKTAAELLELPGFGPYTARAVASLAFDEKTGVLDGNVIRVLSRRYGMNVDWWKPQGRARLQEVADALAQVEHPADLNQGMMELGAMVCTPQSPSCLLCPWVKTCVARQTNKINEYPAKRPRRKREIWHWQPTVVEKDGRILLVANTYAPFLKGHWICPGKVERLDVAPKTYDYRGSVTHHDIFVSIGHSSRWPKAHWPQAGGEVKWVNRSALEREVPASLIRKAIERAPAKR